MCNLSKNKIVKSIQKSADTYRNKQSMQRWKSTINKKN